MMRRQRRPLPPLTEKKWEAATSRSTKRGPRASTPSAVVAAADAPVVGVVAADSRMRITANRLASRANRAGDPNTLGYLRRSMSITFQKRQKELKRQEKQRAKAEKREQKKLAKRAADEASKENSATPPKSETQN